MSKKYLILFISFIVIISACNKEKINNTDEKIGISRVTHFPLISINGEQLIILQKGDTYTEPGAIATLNNEPTAFTLTGSVDVTVPGVYDLVYSAVNADGFSASDFRTVVVIGDDVSANDFSGDYLRAATGVVSNWTKTGNGIYMVNNPGGAGVGGDLNVIVVNYSGNEIAIPYQVTSDGNKVRSNSATYNADENPITYSWALTAGGYGTQERFFTKQ